MGATKEERRSSEGEKRLAEKQQMGTASCTPTELAISEWRQPNATHPTRRINPTRESFTEARGQQSKARLQEAGASASLTSRARLLAKPSGSISKTSDARQGTMGGPTSEQ